MSKKYIVTVTLKDTKDTVVIEVDDLDAIYPALISYFSKQEKTKRKIPESELMLI